MPVSTPITGIAARGEQPGDGRWWIRQVAVGGVNRAVPAADRARDHALDAQCVQRGGDADDVDDRVERTDLVELDRVRDRCRAPRPSASARPANTASAIAAHRRRQVGLAEQFSDRLRRPVRMPVIVRSWSCGWSSAVVTWSSHDDVGPRRRDPTALHPFERERIAVDAEPAQRRRDLVSVRAGVDQGPEQHVAGHPRRALDVRDPCHRRTLRSMCARRIGPTDGAQGPSRQVIVRPLAHGSIRATAHAAPKPLSMPTTVTPLAHDESMASSGGDAFERGAVADAGRHGDDRGGGQAADDAGEGALHPGDHDDRIGRRDRVDACQQAVQAGDTDVGDAHRCEPVGTERE